jgi:hypothetical protein
MSTSSYLLSRSIETQVVRPASAPIWTVFMGTSSLAEGCTRGAEAEPHGREFGGAGSWLLGFSAASRAATRAWSFSSAQAPTSQSSRIMRTPLEMATLRPGTHNGTPS